jgi:uracil-DNA glycosylase family 4
MRCREMRCRGMRWGIMVDVRERWDARMKVRECSSCGLCKVGSGPIPFAGGLSERSLVVVGEAPGRIEDEERQPFVGPAGRVARGWLTDAGANLIDVAWMNVVSCYPNRTPTEREVAACAHNADSQLDYLNPSYVLIFGGVALAALCPVKTRISEAAGYPFRIKYGPGRTKSALAMATWHPAAALRNPSLVEKGRADVEFLVACYREECLPDDHQFCVKCKDREVDVFHECGLGYCGVCRKLVGV